MTLNSSTADPAPGAVVETVFDVPLLRDNSVACNGCCPVPAEALIVPEIELLPGVLEASADWQSAEVRVRHTPEVDVREVAAVLADLSYPAAGWRPAPHAA